MSGRFERVSSDRPESIGTPGAVVAWYAERFARDIDRLKIASGDEILRTFDFRGIAQMSAL